MQKHSTAKLQEVLSFSKAIVSGNAQLAPIEMNLEIKDTFDQPIIRSVFKGDSSVIAFSVIKVLVNRFIDSFGFSTKLSDSQIDVLVVDTIENFKYESLHDIILFFKMARSGKFGSTKRGVDSNLIFGEWFPMYMEQKADLREQLYQKEKIKHTQTLATTEDVIKTYTKHHNKNFEERVKKYADSITQGITREQLEVLIEEWNNDEQKKPYVRILKAKRREIK